MSLAQMHAEQIQPNTAPLPREEVERLYREITGWTLSDKSIERTFVFKDFRQAIDFVMKVADIAQEQDHHPDISISFNKVKIDLSTHKIGGLSINDFVLAAKIDRVVA